MEGAIREKSCVASAVSTSSDDEEQPSLTICKFYSEGKCRFAENCINLHEGPIKFQKKKKQNSVVPKDFEAPYVEKKPPLRTAGDVRKRIQWDTTLPNEYFTVGYIDRFTGLQEQPFNTFTWGHLALAKINDLAIPEHRIQYFKYKNTKVWDKTVRLDHVFGSSGNKKTIEEAMIDIEAKNNSEEGHWESDSDEENVIVNDGARATQPQIFQKNVNQRRPTHFLCIKVNAKGNVASEVKKIQDTIVEEDPDLATCATPIELLHVTLCMIKCQTPKAIEKVEQFLTKFKEEISSLETYNTSGNIIKVKGVNTFKSKVLYSQLEVPPLFTNLVKVLESKLNILEGIVVTNHFEFIPHLTILKVNKTVADLRHSQYISSSLYDQYINTKLGQISVDNIHLCVLSNSRGSDQFYETKCTINF